MKKYIQTYLNHFGFCEQDAICCERCGSRANDIHHITFRSQGGTDDIDNLMALCRECHNDAHQHRVTSAELQIIHGKLI